MRGDVHAGSDEKQAVGPGVQRVGAGQQRGQFSDRIGAGRQRLTMDVGDRPVGAIDHGQRRGVGLDEQQPGLGISHGAADDLGQRRGSQKGRHQHDVLDLARRQRVAQRSGLDRIRPGHTRRSHLVATLRGTFLGAEDRRHDLVGRTDGRRVGAASTSKPSSSTVRPSAFSPSTRTMRTAVGAIDTPSTVSTSPPKLLAPGRVRQNWLSRRATHRGLPGFPQALARATRIDFPVFATTTLPTGGLGGYQLTAELPTLTNGRGRRGPNRHRRGPSHHRRGPNQAAAVAPALVAVTPRAAIGAAAGRTVAVRAREESAQ